MYSISSILELLLIILQTDEDEDDEDDDEDDDEYIDIDPAEIFATLSKGKEFLSFAELTEWDLLKDMKAAGDMSDKQLKEIIKTAGALSLLVSFY